MNRITAAFNSPRYAADAAGLYHVLRTAVTLECGLISSSLSFEQDGIIHEIEISQSELHIDDTNPLTIYVPSDTESQECCFKYDLPHRFASWMMTDPATGTCGKIEDGTVNVINSILNCLISTTGKILEKEGIPDVSGIAETPVPILELDEPAGSTTMAVAVDLRGQGELSPRTPSISQANKRFFSPRPTFSPGPQGGMESTPDPTMTPIDPGDYDTEDDPGTSNDGDYDTEDDPGTPNDGGSDLPEFNIPEQESTSPYRRLLEGVVVLARRTSLPNNFGDISTALQALLIGNNPFEGEYQANTSHGWEHRKRVGAAGELFVSKPGFQIGHH